MTNKYYRERERLSLAERHFVEICEDIEQLGRNGKHQEVEDLGMEYLNELWSQYAGRLRALYRSDAFMQTYMFDGNHGQQLRRNLKDSNGKGFVCPDGTRERVYTAVHFFAHLGCTSELRLLMTRGSINPNTLDHVHKTPLIRAAHMGHASTVAYLLQLPGVHVEAIDKSNHTALLYASKHNHHEVIKLLLRHLDVEPASDSFYLAGPFLYIAEKGQPSMIKFFLSRDEVDINCKNEDGHTPLHLAVLEGKFSNVRLLLQQPRVDPNTTDRYEETPLICAAFKDLQVIVQELLNRQDTHVDPSDGRGRTPLSYASSHANKTLVELLLKRGASPEITDELGISPMMYAASKLSYNHEMELYESKAKKSIKHHHALLQIFLNYYQARAQPHSRLDLFIKLSTNRVRDALSHGVSASSSHDELSVLAESFRKAMKTNERPSAPELYPNSSGLPEPTDERISLPSKLQSFLDKRRGSGEQ